jgi:hypothetical protein
MVWKASSIMETGSAPTIHTLYCVLCLHSAWERFTTVLVSMKPDVIVKASQHTMLFQPQNRRASEWLCGHYYLPGRNANERTEFRVHPTRYKRIIEELKAAGFVVTSEREESC